jgi:hypothetical protein
MHNFKNITYALTRIYRDFKGEIQETDFIPITGEKLEKLSTKAGKKLFEISPFRMKNYNHKIPLIVDEEEKMYLLNAKNIILCLTPHLPKSMTFDYRLEYAKRYLPGFVFSYKNKEIPGSYYL